MDIWSSENLERCSDVEFLSIIALRRVPHGWEIWKNAPVELARLMIRSLGEFVVAHPHRIELTHPGFDKVIPSSKQVVERAYKVIVNRSPTLSEIASWTQHPDLSISRLAATLFYSLEGLVADGLANSTGEQPEHAALRRQQLNVNYLQQDIYSSVVFNRIDHNAQPLSKLGTLKKESLQIAINIFGISETDQSLIIENLRKFAPKKKFSISKITVNQILDGELNNYDVFLTNNNFMYEKFLEQSASISESNCVSALWHWDCHHQFDFSEKLINVFDFIFPAHSTGALALHGGNAIIGSIVPCCVFQWSSSEASSFFQESRTSERSNNLYGRFNSYPGRTGLRDTFLRSASKSLPDNSIVVIGHRENQWAGQTTKNRFNEVMHSKAVICNPIYNDIPARLFDALLVGAIPIIPYGLPDLGISFSEEEYRSLPIVTYFPDDLSSLAVSHANAVKLFDAEGLEGAYRRHKLALDKHMLHHRIARLIFEVVNLADYR